MRTIRGAIALPLLATVMIGCSRSGVKETVSASGGSSLGLASALPNLPTGSDHSAAGKGASGETGKFIPPFPENVDLFSPPKVVVPVVTREEEPPPEPKKEPAKEPETEVTPLPPLRLLGFVDVEGLKALLSVDGKLTVTTIGDSISGVQVVAVEPPAVVLKHGDNEFKMNLFDQEWFHQPHITGPLFGTSKTAKTVGGKTVYQRDPVFPQLPGPDKKAPAMPKLPTLSGNNERPQLPQLPGFDRDSGLKLPELPGIGSRKADDKDVPRLPQPSGSAVASEDAGKLPSLQDPPSGDDAGDRDEHK